jgi:hypothetical protein
MNEILRAAHECSLILMRDGEVDCGNFVVACVVQCVARDHGINAEREGPHVRKTKTLTRSRVIPADRLVSEEGLWQEIQREGGRR